MRSYTENISSKFLRDINRLLTMYSIPSLVKYCTLLYLVLTHIISFNTYNHHLKQAIINTVVIIFIRHYIINQSMQQISKNEFPTIRIIPDFIQLINFKIF